MPRVSNIPIDIQPESDFQAPLNARSKPKALVIKVQLPHTGPNSAASTGPLMIYTKKRDLVCQIVRADNRAGYDRISQFIREKGVGGSKAYLAAELQSKDELVVKLSEVLAVQPW